MTDLRDTYNRIAEDWANDHTEDSWWVAGTDRLIALLPTGATVLDVGCGPGNKARHLVDHGLNVTGIDFSEKMIEIAQREVPEAYFEVHDMYELDTLPNTYDCVFAQASLLHIPKRDVPLIITKMKTVLRSNGLLYIAVKERRPGEPDEAVLRERDYGYEFERFFSYFAPEEVRRFVVDAGLSVLDERVEQTNHTRWIQLIARNVAA